MKVVFVGLQYFGKKLTHDLNAFAPQHSFSFFDTYTSKVEQVKFAAALPFADLLISLNGVSDKSGSLDLAITMKRKIIMHWQGTDVLAAMESAKKRNINRKYIDYSENYTDAPWLKDELKTIDINCSLLEYKWLDSSLAPEKFKTISTYTYLAKDKEEFYGWHIIRQLAEMHPEVDFFIAGTEGKGLKEKKNIHFLGWVDKDKMAELRTNNPIFLRLPQHDGYSLSVLEALSCGNEVIWSIPHSQSRFAVNFNEADKAFNKITEELKNRGLKRNENNILFVKNNLSKEKILGTFINKLEAIA